MKEDMPATERASEEKSIGSYEVFHLKDEAFHKCTLFGLRYLSAKDMRDAFLASEYNHVATFQRPLIDIKEELEKIFRDTQNLEESWRGKDECRSTAVGDVIQVGKNYWIVDSEGYTLGWQD